MGTARFSRLAALPFPSGVQVFLKKPGGPGSPGSADLAGAGRGCLQCRGPKITGGPFLIIVFAAIFVDVITFYSIQSTIM